MATRRTRTAAWALVAMSTAGLVNCRPGTTPPPPPPTGGGEVPVIFVHGFMGSEAQYRSQQLRFASNGFPAERVLAFHYDTQAVDSAGLDTLVDEARRRFGTDRVHLVGHSLGTFVVNNYVNANAAKVGRFILVDGAGCPAGNQSCLAIRASELGQTHVEASVSAESFDRQYRFLLGKAPTTTAIVPETAPKVSISGHALDLQTNAASAAGVTAQVWAVDPATGARQGGTPAATFTIGAAGAWGPVQVDRGKHYEIAAVSTTGLTMHFYFQPFTRSSSMVHLTTATATSGSAQNTNRGPNHTALSIQRQREFWRSHGAANDTLTIAAPGQAPADVFRNVRNDAIGVHVHDDKATPGATSLSLLPWFSQQPFQTGVDVFMPAANPPTGTIAITNVPRGDAAKPQRIAVPNWASSAHAVQVEFDDHAP